MASQLLWACTTNDTFAVKTAQDEWLAQNYPNRTFNKARETPAVRTQYYDAIKSGSVMVGMNLAETQTALKMKPYGDRPMQAVFWCNGASTAQCQADCPVCASVMFAATHIIYLQGRGDQPEAVKILAKQESDTMDSFRERPFNVVDALFVNKVVPGMSVADFERIEFPAHATREYYCYRQRVFQSCLRSCGDCKVEISIPNEGVSDLQVIQLKGRYDFQTVTDVKRARLKQ